MCNHDNHPSNLHSLRHSLSHIMAQAVQRIHQADAEIAIWPAIDNGFYYDFVFSPDHPLTEEDLHKIQDMMTKIIKENQPFTRLDVSDEESKFIVEKILKQKYKAELRDEFASNGETISFYLNSIPEAAKDALLAWSNPDYIEYYESVSQYFQEKYKSEFEGRFITFLDMCEWPHVESTKDIESWTFKVAKTAGAYWRWDSKNVMMTRIYAYAFETKDELKDYLNFIQEAKKRDHRILGQKLKLFTISPLIGAGLPLMQPKWMTMRKEVEDFLRELHEQKWYLRVWTPHIAKIDLYQTSWHAAKFGDELFRVKWKEEEFIMKPMNCPHHMQIFADNQFSYRDMPVRYFEPATVYRDEKTGQLSGLTRVRSITQDDGHLFCRVDQIKDEVKAITDIIKQFFWTLWMLGDYWVSLSVRWDDKSKYLGSDEVRNIAEASLEEAAKANDLPYKRVEWEAAFYGPKLDFMFKDALGRERQLSTIQCDFNLPERFQLEYTDQHWEKQRPVVIHRAIAGSFERFLGIMIEHFAGAFPLRLAPEQVRIIPVADAFLPYAHQVEAEFKKLHLRASVDDGNDSFSKKIRNGELEKVPYLLIVWEKEEKADSVSIREFKTKEQSESGLLDFVQKVKVIRDERRL